MIVVVLVALGQATDPSTQALTAAAQDGLGPVALIVVREAPPESLAQHANSEKTGELLHADAVATIEWSDDAHEHARVSVYSTHDREWQDRSVSFVAADAPSERGRQLGFGIAAMVPPTQAPPPPPPQRQNPPPRGGETPPSQSVTPSRETFDVDAAGVGASGVAGGFGAELSLRWRASRFLSIRGGAGARFGSISAAESTFADFRFDAGPAVIFFSTRAFEMGARADFVMTRIGVSRDASLVNASGSHWVGGVDLLLEGALGLAQNFALIAAAGGEADFGSTRIVVDGTEIDHAAQVRALGEIGIRVRF